jgi:2-oxoisovalerate dehydrogenase E2 component (dihydrolipoyl transacylase)
MLRHFALPDLGEGLTEADILGWLVSEGDEIALNQPIVEVETAKAAVEVPSPWAGVVRTLHVPTGKTVLVGTTIISIETSADEHAADLQPGGGDAGAAPASEAMLVGYGPRPAQSRRRRRMSAVPSLVPSAFMPPLHSEGHSQPHSDVTVLAKPPVRKLARDLGVDLRTIRGSGPAGSITRADVGAVAPAPSLSRPPAPSLSRQRADHPAQGTADQTGGRMPLHGLRKAMAEAMTESAFTAPHATVFLTVDATETLRLRTALAARPEFAATPITPLAVVARAVCVAVRDAPLINSGFDAAAQEIVLHDQINLGIAVATPRGLLVPNIKDAGNLSLVALAAALGELTMTAREGHTRPADLAAGTLTITNVGVFGVDGGTPILNPGESAILCLGAIKPKPWVHEGELAVRDVVQLSMSFDHRIVDGQVASQFLAAVGAMVTDPRLLLALA